MTLDNSSAMVSTNRFKKLSRPLVTLMAALLIIAGGCERAYQPVRPFYDGYALAAVDSLPATPDPARKYHQFGQFVALLDIDTAGCVTGARALRKRDSSLVVSLAHHFDNLSFLPALKDSTAVASILPVDVIWNSPGDYVRLRFPLRTDGWRVEQPLYNAALELNGRDLPRLVEVPSYYTKILTNDYFPTAPYRLYQVSLGSEGTPVEIRSLGGSYPGYDHHLGTALNWSRYEAIEPPEGDSLARLYVVFALYPGLVYPTSTYMTAATDTLSILERLRIQVFPDTLGTMLFPMLTRSLDSVALIKKTRLPTNRGPWSALVKIDSTGKGELVTKYFDQGQTRQAYKYYLAGARFYPAVDFHGRPVEFEGLAYLTFVSDTTVRVEFGWLSEPSF